MISQLLTALAILVGVHEAGHMIAAKYFGMRVEKFSIGFPPKLLGFKKGETEYSLGLIPLGGFVKISGMVDESFDTKDLDKEPEPWEFRAKPAWQRLIVMLGGIIVNVITGIIVFILIYLVWGKPYVPKDALAYGVIPSEYGEKLGFKNGDQILKVNGNDYVRYDELFAPEVLYSDNPEYIVKREIGGAIDTIVFPDNFLDEMEGGFITPSFEFTVGSYERLELPEDTATNAQKAGIKEGDQIIEVGGKTIKAFHHLSDALKAYSDEVVTMKVQRGDSVLVKEVKIDTMHHMGIYPKPKEFDHDTTTFSFAGAISQGAKDAFATVTNNIIGLGKIITGKVSASKGLASPIRIATFFGPTWEGYNFWRWVAILSMVLAFMNLLPIPALDGGHVVFLLYEMISGKKPSDKFMEWAIKVGFILLISIIIFSFGNDIYRAVMGKF